MAFTVINNTAVGSILTQILNAQDIQPGTPVGYELCKLLWIYHPMARKMVEKPVKLAQSKPRKLSMECSPKDELVEAFQDEWDRLGCTDHIRDVMFITRAYGIGSLVYGAPKIATDVPIDPWTLPDLEIYFNHLDPLNTAGSIITNQNPNAPDFQKPKAEITAAGQPYHQSRSVVLFHGTPIYLSYQASTFGFSGFSVFQSALYPLKSYIQSMITDDLVTTKAGLIIAKQKQAGSIVNRIMEKASGIKRSFIKEGQTGNVLTIDVDEDIESLNLENTDKAMTTARDNIIANIATASDVPALILKDEAFTKGFGEGTEDAKAIAQYINGVRTEMAPLYRIMDKIVMHRAWNKKFFEGISTKYPDIYNGMTYEQAFYAWERAFKALWPNFLDEPESEKSKVTDAKVDRVTKVLDSLMPSLDPVNKSLLVSWAQAQLNEMDEEFTTPMELDIELLSEYMPPQPETNGGGDDDDDDK